MLGSPHVHCCVCCMSCLAHCTLAWLMACLLLCLLAASTNSIHTELQVFIYSLTCFVHMCLHVSYVLLLLQLDEPKGTPAYLAPEVATQGLLSRSADIWSLGVILWQVRAFAPLLYALMIHAHCTLCTDLLPMPTAPHCSSKQRRRSSSCATTGEQREQKQQSTQQCSSCHTLHVLPFAPSYVPS
jgi:serine/threonine protein kinase